MHAQFRRDGGRPRDGGAVLLTVLLVMMALMGLGITALWLTTSGMQVGANTNLRNQALYVAEMGIEAVRADLNTNPPRPVDPIIAGAGGSVCDADASLPQIPDSIPTLDGDNDAWDDGKNLPNGGIGVVYADTSGRRWCNVTFPTAASGIVRTGTTPNMGSYTVYIRNDNMELKKKPPLITDDRNETLVVRSIGTAPDGRTTVVLEVTMGPGATPATPPSSLRDGTPVLCNSGKNACDENSSVQAGVVVE